MMPPHSLYDEIFIQIVSPQSHGSITFVMQKKVRIICLSTNRMWKKHPTGSDEGYPLQETSQRKSHIKHNKIILYQTT